MEDFRPAGDKMLSMGAPAEVMGRSWQKTQGNEACAMLEAAEVSGSDDQRSCIHASTRYTFVLQ